MFNLLYLVDSYSEFVAHGELNVSCTASSQKTLAALNCCDERSSNEQSGVCEPSRSCGAYLKLLILPVVLVCIGCGVT
jgi:hypothetical protein